MQLPSVRFQVGWRVRIVAGLIVAAVASGCMSDDTPYRQHTARDAVPPVGTLEPGNPGFEVQNTHLVDPRQEFGDDFQLDTTDILRFETPGLCDGCGAYVLSFSSQGWMEEAVAYFERRNAANGTPLWIIEVRRNLLLLIDAGWPETAVQVYLTGYCYMADNCLEE